MNIATGIRKPLFLMLFTTVHCISYNSCNVAKMLDPQAQLLQLYINKQSFTTEQWTQMSETMTVQGIPNLNNTASMNNTERLHQFYHVFNVIYMYLSNITTDNNQELENYLIYHQINMERITDEIKETLGITFNSEVSISTPESNFEKKLLDYKVLKLYKEWLDALKKCLC